jgi:hypothetical protein
VRGVVEPVAGERGEIETADVGDPVVDDHELLVVAMHRAFLRVELHLDLRAPRQLLAHRAHFRAIRMEERQRRPRPREHAHGATRRGVGKEPAQRRPVGAHPERRREEPAGDVDVRLRRCDVLDHPRQQLAAVDEELDPVAATGRERPSLGPAAGRRSGRTMAAPCEPAAVM